MNIENVNFKSIELDGIDTNDYPDFCDAFISYAEYENGELLDDDALDVLNDDSSLVYDLVIERLF